jgi:hypothetical protein
VEPVAGQPDDNVSVTLRLSDTQESRNLWDLTFNLDYKVSTLKLLIGAVPVPLNNGNNLRCDQAIKAHNKTGTIVCSDRGNDGKNNVFFIFVFSFSVFWIPNPDPQISLNLDPQRGS